MKEIWIELDKDGGTLFFYFYGGGLGGWGVPEEPLIEEPHEELLRQQFKYI